MHANGSYVSACYPIYNVFRIFGLVKATKGFYKYFLKYLAKILKKIFTKNLYIALQD